MTDGIHLKVKLCALGFWTEEAARLDWGDLSDDTKARGVPVDPDLGEQAEACGRVRKFKGVPGEGDDRGQKLTRKQTAWFQNPYRDGERTGLESEGPTFCLWAAACDGAVTQRLWGLVPQVGVEEPWCSTGLGVWNAQGTWWVEPLGVGGLLGLPLSRQGRAQQGRTSYQPKERGHSGASTGEASVFS